LLAINPTTVVRVYTELEREGVIEMRHGKGAFVTDSGRRMTAAERDKSLRLLARQLAVEATQMGAPASQVLKVVREELADFAGRGGGRGAGESVSGTKVSHERSDY